MSNKPTFGHKEEDEYQFPEEEFLGGEPQENFHPEDEALYPEAKFDELSFGEEEEKEEEKIAEPSMMPPSSPPVQKTWKDFLVENRRVIAVIGIICIGFIAFTFMRPTHHKETVAVQQPTNIPSLPNVSVPSQAPAVNDLGTMRNIDELKRELADSQAQVSQLQNQLSSLQTSFEQSRAAESELNQKVVLLLEEIKQMKNVKKPGTATKPSAPLPVYSLHALVPGRAWIVNPSGESKTVTIGDGILGYGEVTRIDADQGIVVTSSGKVITFPK